MPKVQFQNWEALGPECPICKVKLVVRTNREKGNQFLGCPNWPECSHTEGIPDEYVLRKLGQRGMFDPPPSASLTISLNIKGGDPDSPF